MKKYVLIILNIIFCFFAHYNVLVLNQAYKRYFYNLGIYHKSDNILNELPVLTSFFVRFYWLPYLFFIIATLLIMIFYKIKKIPLNTIETILFYVLCIEFITLFLLSIIYILPFCVL